MQQETPYYYHKLSELVNRDGYWPNLSDMQVEALKELDALLLSHPKIELNYPDLEHRKLRLLRFLRARDFNVKAACDMIKADTSWRNSPDMMSFSKLSPKQVLGLEDLSEFFVYFPTWIQGFDRQNRPVAYRKFGNFRISKVLELTKMENLIKFHGWESEQVIRYMNWRSKEYMCNIETFLTIVDAEGVYLFSSSLCYILMLT